jgi:hypothetical protein
MKRRARRGRMLAAGLMTVAVPLIGWQRPASAAMTEDTQTKSLTFVSTQVTGQQAATCTLLVDAGHNTNNANDPIASMAWSLSGSPNSLCTDADVRSEITFKDRDGVTRTATTTDGSNLTVSGAVSGIRATSSAFFKDCDPTRSATCTLDVTAAPK